MNAGVTSPRKKLSAGRKALRAKGRQFEGWSAAQRERVASQLHAIRHWKIIEGDYRCAPSIAATWFVDPPYAGRAGSYYVHGSSKIDYEALAGWCVRRRGQVIVCEAMGARWLPFRRFIDAKAGPATRQVQEAIWTNE